jgi:hypothetical protein
LVDESLLVNQANNGISNLVVWLSVEGPYPQPHPMYAVNANADVSLDASTCRLEPHVTLVRTSQTLVLRNAEPYATNLCIDSVRNHPVCTILKSGDNHRVGFDRGEEKHPASVRGTIQSWLSGWIIVKATPYMAATDNNGQFTIQNLPQGDWTFQVWHESAGHIESITINGDKMRWENGLFGYNVGPGVNDLGNVLIDPSEFEAN